MTRSILSELESGFKLTRNLISNQTQVQQGLCMRTSHTIEGDPCMSLNHLLPLSFTHASACQLEVCEQLGTFRGTSAATQARVLL